MNRKQEIFKWHGETFFNWKKALSREELEYIDTCLAYEVEPLDPENKLSSLAFSHSVSNKKINSSRIGVGTLAHIPEIQPFVKAILDRKGITLPFDLEVYGVGWDVEENHLKIYSINPVGKIKKLFPKLSKLKPDNVYERGLISYTFKGKEIYEEKVYFYDLFGAIMITDKRGAVRQYHDDVNLNTLSGTLNPVGQNLVSKYKAIGVGLDTLNFQNSNNYVLYFDPQHNV